MVPGLVEKLGNRMVALKPQKWEGYKMEGTHICDSMILKFAPSQPHWKISVKKILSNLRGSYSKLDGWCSWTHLGI
jgi:hypothetical protein